jgi:hypothetical protein
MCLAFRALLAARRKLLSVKSPWHRESRDAAGCDRNRLVQPCWTFLVRPGLCPSRPCETPA